MNISACFERGRLQRAALAVVSELAEPSTEIGLYEEGEEMP